MAIITSIRNGQGAITETSPGVFATTGVQEDDLMQTATDYVARAGVLHPVTIGSVVQDFKVSQRGAGANMSVDVSSGTAYVQNSSWTEDNTSNTKYWRVVNDATINAVIGANASGNPRIDIVCILVNTATTPDANATNVASIVVTAGTPSATPAVPATPANSLKLAEVAVANGAVSIVTANITDRQVSSQLDIGDGFDASMNRQAFMNSNFEFWERLKYASFSVSNPATTAFTADRMVVTITLDGGTNPTTITHSRQSLTAGDILGSFYYYRIAPNGAGSGYGANSLNSIGQRIEFGTRYLAGLNKKVTVTFWARASVASKKLGVGMQQTYGTGGAPSATEHLAGTNFTLTSSWVKYSWTFNTNTIVGKTFGTSNNDYLELDFYQQWGATIGSARVGATAAEGYGGNGTIDIAQVQVNAGDNALAYQPYDQASELLKCQRYTFIPDIPAVPSVIGHGIANANNTCIFYIKLPTRMRIVPVFAPAVTAGDWQASNFIGSATATGLAVRGESTDDFLILILTAAATPFTGGSPYFLTSTGTNKIMVLSAEL